MTTHRHAGAYPRPEAWALTDRRSGAKLGRKSYPTLAAALDVRRHLMDRAATVSAECRAEVVAYCDVRKEG